jgi:Rieske Fe-S protein
MSEPEPEPPPPTDRREFLKGAACVALGACALGIPLAAGIRVLVSPIGAQRGNGYVVKLTTLNALPAGGAPLLFEVRVERTDAWTRHPLTAIGAVFLQRIGDREVRAFNASCPHLGCAVEWRTESKTFFCPCHTSSFTVDGVVIQPSPAARQLDVLEVELREEDEVWVHFQDFKAGTAVKIAVS